MQVEPVKLTYPMGMYIRLKNTILIIYTTCLLSVTVLEITPILEHGPLATVQLGVIGTQIISDSPLSFQMDPNL